MKKKPKPDPGKKSWPGQPSTNPFANPSNIHQTHGRPNQFQVRPVIGRRGQRGR